MIKLMPIVWGVAGLVSALLGEMQFYHTCFIVAYLNVIVNKLEEKE